MKAKKFDVRRLAYPSSSRRCTTFCFVFSFDFRYLSILNGNQSFLAKQYFRGYPDNICHRTEFEWKRQQVADMPRNHFISNIAKWNSFVSYLAIRRRPNQILCNFCERKGGGEGVSACAPPPPHHFGGISCQRLLITQSTNFDYLIAT